MTRHRFIVKNITSSKSLQKIELTDRNQIKQILKVLRLKEGDQLDIIDGKGSLYVSKIQKASELAIELEVLETVEETDETESYISIALAVLKGAKFEWALQKLTEIGVHELIPVYTDRCVVKPKESSLKFRRWMSIINEATEQSERPKSPLLKEPVKFEQYLTSVRDIKHSSADEKFGRDRYIALSRVDANPLMELLSRQRTTDASPVIPPKHIQIIIGPEGGFTDSEITIAKEADFIPCNLGKTVLRSETAAIVAAVITLTVGDFL